MGERWDCEHEQVMPPRNIPATSAAASAHQLDSPNGAASLPSASAGRDMGEALDLSDSDLAWLVSIATGLNPALPSATSARLISSRLIAPVTPSVNMVTPLGLGLLSRACAAGRLRRHF